MASWGAAREAVKSLKIEHVEKRTFSYILGRTVVGCAHCRALKGSREWEYDCKGAGDGKKEATDA